MDFDLSTAEMVSYYCDNYELYPEPLIGHDPDTGFMTLTEVYEDHVLVILYGDRISRNYFYRDGSTETIYVE